MSQVKKRIDGAKKWLASKTLIWSVMTVALLLLSAVFYATAGFGMREVHQKKGVNDYSVAELNFINDEIKKSNSDFERAEIVDKYHLIDDPYSFEGDYSTIVSEIISKRKAKNSSS